MILLLDTSMPTCCVSIWDGQEMHEVSWVAERQLASGLLKFLEETLASRSMDWQGLKGIGVFQGPGSFTGLRIGMTVANTLADSLGLPIVAQMHDDWKEQCIRRLIDGESDKVALPFYGAEANITKPRK